eukprot:TRINITY_DN18061_c0_g1_i1.p1 TRINITY_DN18061_c0_g1~~TRINITY_DN18061_c0_g1_i1.p1  ORF type:complete len:137 (-),score=21.77 TRINITY_DN18061_c0_g1_i1:76-486(-)
MYNNADTYGPYTPAPVPPPLPPFPCREDPTCTEENRKCETHKYVLFVKNVDKLSFTISYGHWESWEWYKERIQDATGIPVNRIRIIFAGAQRDGIRRHSGLQYQSTIHFVPRDHPPRASHRPDHDPSSETDKMMMD